MEYNGRHSGKEECFMMLVWNGIGLILLVVILYLSIKTLLQKAD